MTTRGDRRELVVSAGDYAHLRTVLDDDPAAVLAVRWGYVLTSGWRESGRVGYVLAGVRHIRGGSTG